MIVKTTKQIWAEAEAFIYDLSKDSVEPEQKWVCLESLKKEKEEKLQAIRHNAVTLAKHSYETAYAYLLDCIDNELCNSSEQNEYKKELGLAKFDVSTPTVSVSGEHNTGESESVLKRAPERISESKNSFSPVHIYNAKLINNNDYWYIETEFGIIELGDDVIEDIKILISLNQNVKESKHITGEESKPMQVAVEKSSPVHNIKSSFQKFREDARREGVIGIKIVEEDSPVQNPCHCKYCNEKRQIQKKCTCLKSGYPKIYGENKCGRCGGVL